MPTKFSFSLVQITSSENKASLFEITTSNNEVSVYYHITVVESDTHYYKIINWTTAENKAKLKSDFDAIALSFKD